MKKLTLVTVFLAIVFAGGVTSITKSHAADQEILAAAICTLFPKNSEFPTENRLCLINVDGEVQLSESASLVVWLNKDLVYFTDLKDQFSYELSDGKIEEVDNADQALWPVWQRSGDTTVNTTTFGTYSHQVVGYMKGICTIHFNKAGTDVPYDCYGGWDESMGANFFLHQLPWELGQNYKILEIIRDDGTHQEVKVMNPDTDFYGNFMIYSAMARPTSLSN